MEKFGSGGSVVQKLSRIEQLGDSSTGDAVFDASQYAFFGKDVMEEVELGGLEDVEDNSPAVEFEEDFLFDNQEEGDDLRSLSDIDDLASTFLKLNKVVMGPRAARIISDRESRESSSAAEWVQGQDLPKWYDEKVLDPEGIQDSKIRSSQQYSVCIGQSRPLYRTTTYPEQQPLQKQQHNQQFSSEPILVPRPYPLCPLPGRQSPQVSPSHNRLNVLHHSGSHQMTSSLPNFLPLSGSQLQFAGLAQGSPRHGGSISLFASGLSANGRSPNQGSNHSGLYPADHPDQLNNKMPSHSPHLTGLIPPQLMPQLQPQLQRLKDPSQPSLGLLPSAQHQLFNPHISPSPQLMTKYEAVLGLGDVRDQRPKSAQKVRQNLHYFQQGFHVDGQGYESGWPQFRSKYMTADEIETIHRMQLAATHTNDPYVDDYYHQAFLAKKSASAKLKHHFCPTHLRDLPSRARANNEPHPFLQVDALGRVPFSSIRRPRPLLEVDPPNSSIGDVTEQKNSEKPLEQEPMLAVRVVIEDGLCLLLDVDDIDRYLEFNQLQDDANQLRCRREALLGELLESLQLLDPLGNHGDAVGLAPNDDLVFLRIASLPKGRKLLTRYLQLLFPCGDLMRILCMAICRHLRFLFGVLPSDFEASQTTNNLSRVVSICVRRLELASLSASLAAVVCSSEHPPLRPLGNSAGNGASLILMAVLERAGELLNDLHDSSPHNATHRLLWKASFDEFFGLLIKYCINKYDSIMLSSLPDTAEAIKRELPMELLRASVPHTTDYQKKLLYDLSQRSLVGQGGGDGDHIRSKLVQN